MKTKELQLRKNAQFIFPLINNPDAKELGFGYSTEAEFLLVEYQKRPRFMGSAS